MAVIRSKVIKYNSMIASVILILSVILCLMFFSSSKKICVLQQQQKRMCWCSVLGNLIHIHAICHIHSSNPAGAGLCMSHTHTHTKHSLLTIHWKTGKKTHNLRIAKSLVSCWLRGSQKCILDTRPSKHTTLNFTKGLDHYRTMARSLKKKKSPVFKARPLFFPLEQVWAHTAAPTSVCRCLTDWADCVLHCSRLGLARVTV